MTELFPIEAVAMDSPRLAWLKRHGLVTEMNPNAGLESAEQGDDIPKWVCRVSKTEGDSPHFKPNEIGGGETEDDACADLAINRGLRHWSEEGGA